VPGLLCRFLALAQTRRRAADTCGPKIVILECQSGHGVARITHAAKKAMSNLASNRRVREKAF
jgi:hypothetical protein